MSNKSSLRNLVVLLFAAFASAALVLVDAGALAQNANSSPTEDAAAQNSNGAAPAPRRGRRGRRGRAAAANANANANTGDATGADTGTTDPAMDPSGQTGGGTGSGTGAGSGDVSGEQTDLSGTYTGQLTMTGGHEMSGEATITITGNSFTLTSGGMTHNGRVYAVTTRGYVGAAFYFSDVQDPGTQTPVVANVRARRSGDRLTLSPVPGASTRLTFGTAGGGTRGRRGRRPAAATETNSNTGDNSNATPPR